MERLVRWYMERLVQAKYGRNGSMFEIKSVLYEPLRWITWFTGTWNAWFRLSMEQMVRCLKL